MQDPHDPGLRPSVTCSGSSIALIAGVTVKVGESSPTRERVRRRFFAIRRKDYALSTPLSVNSGRRRPCDDDFPAAKKIERLTSDAAAKDRRRACPKVPRRPMNPAPLNLRPPPPKTPIDCFSTHDDGGIDYQTENRLRRTESRFADFAPAPRRMPTRKEQRERYGRRERSARLRKLPRNTHCRAKISKNMPNAMLCRTVLVVISISSLCGHRCASMRTPRRQNVRIVDSASTFAPRTSLDRRHALLARGAFSTMALDNIVVGRPCRRCRERGL